MSQPFPERIAVVLIGKSAHLGDDTVGKSVRMFGHKQKAGTGQQATAATTTETRSQKQGAEFAAAGVIVTQIQSPEFVVDIELVRGVHNGTDMVVVPGRIQPDRGGDTTGS